MKSTKKLTLSAAAVAITSVLLMLSSLLGLMELSVGALASLVVVLIFIEVGGAYPWLVWAASSTLSILLLPSKTMGVLYLMLFGVYPILKAFIEKLKSRSLWVVIKFVYISAVIVAFISLTELVLGVPFFEEMPNLSPLVGTLVKGGIILLCYVAFFAYDMFITVLVRLYYLKFRDKFKRIFK